MHNRYCRKQPGIFPCFKNVSYAARKKRRGYKRPCNKARYPDSAFDEYGFNPRTKKDEIKNLPIKEINSLLYCLLETSIFRLGILNQENLDEMRGTVQFVIEQFRTEKK